MHDFLVMALGVCCAILYRKYIRPTYRFYRSYKSILKLQETIQEMIQSNQDTIKTIEPINKLYSEFYDLHKEIKHSNPLKETIDKQFDEIRLKMMDIRVAFNNK